MLKRVAVLLVAVFLVDLLGPLSKGIGGSDPIFCLTVIIGVATAIVITRRSLKTGETQPDPKGANV